MPINTDASPSPEATRTVAGGPSEVSDHRKMSVLEEPTPEGSCRKYQAA
jgi:hypothetical protein